MLPAFQVQHRVVAAGLQVSELCTYCRARQMPGYRVLCSRGRARQRTGLLTASHLARMCRCLFTQRPLHHGAAERRLGVFRSLSELPHV